MTPIETFDRVYRAYEEAVGHPPAMLYAPPRLVRAYTAALPSLPPVGWVPTFKAAHVIARADYPPETVYATRDLVESWTRVFRGGGE